MSSYEQKRRLRKSLRRYEVEYVPLKASRDPDAKTFLPDVVLSCAYCGENHPVEAFYERSDTPRGYRSNCKFAEKRLNRDAYKARKRGAPRGSRVS